MGAQKDHWADGEAYEGYIGRWSRPVAAMFLDWLAAPAGADWVDIGCGTGALAETVLARAAPRSLACVEPSAGYLSVARRRIGEGRADFRQGGAEALPMDDGAADVAVSGLVLNFVPDKAKALSEMRRVVRPGGTIAAYVWDYAGEMQIINRFWATAADLFHDAAARDEGAAFPVCRPDALRDLFAGAGLGGVEVDALDAPAVFTDFDDYWTPFLAGQGPAGAYAAALSPDDQRRLAERLRAALPARPDGSIPLVARAWAVKGTA